VTTGGYFDDMTKLTILKDVQVPFTYFVDAFPAPAPHASTKHVPVKEAKATLTALLHAVEAGERIVITRHGKPVADLVPHAEAVTLKGGRLAALDAWHKENGTDLSKGWIAPDFDDPLPEDFLYSPWPDDIKMPSDGWKKP
jgi:prevent-host-death family protein